jgi:hypothetical protein
MPKPGEFLAPDPLSAPTPGAAVTFRHPKPAVPDARRLFAPQFNAQSPFSPGPANRSVNPGTETIIV